MMLTEEEQEFMQNLFLLTSKPVIYAANISEKDMGKADDELPMVKKVEEFAAKEGSEVLVICAKTEEELSQLPPEEAQMFLEELGLKESGLSRLIKKSYALLGTDQLPHRGRKGDARLTIAKGTKAPQAAGKIHTDFEKGFIRAEVVDWQTLLECGNYKRRQGKGQSPFGRKRLRHQGRRRRSLPLQRINKERPAAVRRGAFFYFARGSVRS